MHHRFEDDSRARFDPHRRDQQHAGAREQRRDVVDGVEHGDVRDGAESGEVVLGGAPHADGGELEVRHAAGDLEKDGDAFHGGRVDHGDELVVEAAEVAAWRGHSCLPRPDSSGRLVP